MIMILSVSTRPSFALRPRHFDLSVRALLDVVDALREGRVAVVRVLLELIPVMNQARDKKGNHACQ